MINLKEIFKKEKKLIYYDMPGSYLVRYYNAHKNHSLFYYIVLTLIGDYVESIF